MEVTLKSILLQFIIIGNFNKTFQFDVYTSCVLRTYDFLSIYGIYFRDVNRVTVKILDSEVPGQDLNYFADEIANIIFTKSKKKPVTFTRIMLKSRNYDNKYTPFLSIPKRFSKTIERGTFRNISSKIKSNSRDKASAYIILVWNEDNLHEALDSEPENVVSYNRGLYLIIFVEEKNEMSLTTLPRFWNDLNTFNVLATTLCFIPGHRNIFIYDPFHYEKSKWGTVKSLRVSDVLKYPNQMFDFMDDFNGYPIRVSLFARPPTSLDKIPTPLRNSRIYAQLNTTSNGFGGVDGCLVSFLSSRLNFTSVISTPTDSNPFGFVFSQNKTITGSLGEAVNKTIDISANGRFMMPYGVDDIDFTIPVMNNRLCAIVPKSERIPQWRMIFHGFTGDTWLFMFGIIILCSCFWYFAKPCNFSKRKTIQTASFTESALDIIAVLLNAPINLPTRLGQRIFVASLLALNVIVTGIFQGTLVQSFSTVSFYPDVNTLDQLDKSGLPIATSLQVFNNDASELMKRLSKKIVSINSSGMERAAHHRDVAAMERKEDAEFIIRMNYTRHGNPLLHIVHQCPTSYFLSYIVPKNSPFLPKFNSIILNFFESGLSNKWYNDFIEAIILEKGSMELDSDKRKPFALHDIQTAFYVLLFGNLLSLIIFALETSLSKYLKQ